MPLDLQKVPYDLNSDNPLVRECLEKKRALVNQPGFGSKSCCAVVEFHPRSGGSPKRAFGNSRMKLPLGFESRFQDDAIRCHGEAAAVMIAFAELLSDKNPEDFIVALYVELSPCAERCAAFLNNLKGNLKVYYSFDHPGEVADWENRAVALCGR